MKKSERMFITLLILLVSLISEILIILLLPPFINDSPNHIAIILLSLNTGLLLGSIFNCLLIGIYLLLKEYSELSSRAFIRRSILFGVFICLVLLARLYALLDVFMLIFLAIIGVALELILSQRNEM
ncbi:MAG: hypothetical protein ACOCXT_02280 [Candidatus Dojkabacteria bacterium]